MIIVVVIVIIFLIVLVIFNSKTLSPVPYFPSNIKDKNQILNALDIQNNQTIIDLGAGDGWVIFDAAKKSLMENKNTEFIAIDINPILIGIMKLRRIFHPNKRNIKIIRGNFFTMDYKRLIQNQNTPTFYLYISPWFLEDVVKKIRTDFTNAQIVSYFYPIKSLQPSETKLTGIHDTFVYNKV